MLTMVMRGYNMDITTHNHFLFDLDGGRFMKNLKDRIQDIDSRLGELPKGSLTYKKINGKEQPYIQRSIDGKTVSYYVKISEREQILLEFEERSRLVEEKKRLLAYMKSLKEILKKNPYLDARVGLGYQNFEDFVCGKQFYVDKTYFITEWLQSDAQVTLITRPRRFGKTMLLSTVETFFDPRFADHPEYFEKLSVWRDEKSREHHGTIPVVSASFGGCKGYCYDQAIKGVLLNLYHMYDVHSYLTDSTQLTDDEKEKYRRIKRQLSNQEIEGMPSAIQTLCELLYKHHHIKPLILLDEYDTPLLEAYTDGYWDEMIGTCRQLFHSAFKENQYYSRAIITGVTKISKNSLFSDMNNIEVDSVTSDAYCDCCGFTEQEVKDALRCQNIDKMSDVKAMYDGFIFGSQRDIYNPWSIINYMRQGQLISYWTNTSNNKLIGDIIRQHPVHSKHEIEQLMEGKKVHKSINEDVTFQYLDGDENSLWSLLLAVGYIKAENVVKNRGMTECDVSVTNKEVMGMFEYEIVSMFENGFSVYPRFADALIRHKIEEVNDFLMDIAYTSMSYFDVGRRPSEKAPENFYHGLVLGLIVSLKDRYRIVSNRESGRGRYDIAMYPLSENEDAFIIEFKVLDEKREKNLEQTAENALKQIEDRDYKADLLAAGIPEGRIYQLGFAFEGKDVLVVEKAP